MNNFVHLYKCTCYNLCSALILVNYWIVRIPVCTENFHVSAHLFHLILCTSVIVLMFHALIFNMFCLSYAYEMWTYFLHEFVSYYTRIRDLEYFA